jgi:3-hydroxyisobutyrate dehydrogenase-like beta-hydroxyacid dehydrogenase
VTRIGLLFPGEMGAALGAAARGDVLWASDGRSEATTRRATEAGLRDVGSVGALAAASDVVLSVCPPAIAERVAAEVAAAGFRGLYVEANAIAPARTEAIADRFRPEGAVVDGAVISATELNLYLSGEAEHVERAAALFEGTAVTPIRLAGGIGAASALKMAFGGWNKIGSALIAQAYAIARAYGVEAELAAEGVEARRVVSAGPKAWRWSGEMEEVASTCAGLGLPEGLGLGAAELFGRWDAHRDRPAELERLLDDLRRD